LIFGKLFNNQLPEIPKFQLIHETVQRSFGTQRMGIIALYDEISRSKIKDQFETDEEYRARQIKYQGLYFIPLKRHFKYDINTNLLTVFGSLIMPDIDLDKKECAYHPNGNTLVLIDDNDWPRKYLRLDEAVENISLLCNVRINRKLKSGEKYLYGVEINGGSNDGLDQCCLQMAINLPRDIAKEQAEHMQLMLGVDIYEWCEYNDVLSHPLRPLFNAKFVSLHLVNRITNTEFAVIKKS